jgi:hypothetical protein
MHIAGIRKEIVMSDIIRVIRVLEYVGERTAIEKQLSQNYVKGFREVANGIVIREAVVGSFPETLDSE